MDLASLIPLAIKVSIMLIVIALGLHATWSDALYLFRRPGMLLRSIVAMNVLVPLLVVVLVLVFKPAPVIGLALLGFAVSPVPPFLPQKQIKIGGTASYAIGLLVAASLLSIVLVPLTVTWFSYVFDREAAVGAAAIAKVVFTTVLLPLAVGMLVRQFAPGLAERLARPAGLIGMLLLVAGALPVLFIAWPSIRALMVDGTVLMMAAIVAIGLLIGHFLGGPDPHDRTVLALSTATRHPAVALLVAVAAGAEKKPELAAILLYLIVGTLVTIPYVRWRKGQVANAHDLTAAHRGTET